MIHVHRTSFAASLAVFLLYAVPAAYPLLIDLWVEQAKLTATDGAVSDQFGWSIAVAGDTALVGAPTAAVDGVASQGAVYVFTLDDKAWLQQAKLTADDGTESDLLGSSVALAGDTALVGADGADVNGSSSQGAAYVFIESGGAWLQQAKLTAGDVTSGDDFGHSVALAGDTALVGAPHADVNGNASQGAAYVFTESGGVWSQQAKLTADDGTHFDQFGIVVLAGDTALVGAPGATVEGVAGQGAVYVFTRSAGVWSQQAKLTANDGAAGDSFGTSVALSDNTALVGTPSADVDGTTDHGAVYVFTESDGAWNQQAKLIAGDGTESAQFGGSVALEDDSALVGARAAGAGGNPQQGTAYVFTRRDEVWSQRAKLSAGDGAAFDQFGRSVALEGDTGLVGAVFADVDGNADQGAAYVFTPRLLPAALEVDVEPRDSDGNDVFEPGEDVEVAPAWRNAGDVAVALLGKASIFSGPPGATYDVALFDADYGTLASESTSSCRESGICFALQVDDPETRPVQHWDAAFEEVVHDPDVTITTTKTWTLHIGDSFTDVPRTHLFYAWIETVLHQGVTSGCGETEYCPLGTSTRGQMPAFVLRAFLGPEFFPEPCVEGQERFDDVPADHLFCPWIEELAERGVVAGCGGGNYCPQDAVTRAQMAIFLLKTLEGPIYTPPECSGIFADVACPSIFADWVEELYNREITTGCTVEPLNYCPSGTNIRGQMAVFLGKAFGLQLYGP